MTDPRRSSFAIAALTGIVGAGIGVEIAKDLLPLWTGLGGWVAALAGGVLLVMLIASPRRQVTTQPAVTPNDDAGWAEFRRELRRSRRNAKPLTLLRLPGPATPTSIDLEVLAILAKRVAGHLRLVDRTWVDDGSIYVLLPESPKDAASILIDRVRAVDPGLLPVDVRVATFPDDGLTSGAIIAAIHGAMVAPVPTPLRATAGEASSVEATEPAEKAALP